MLRGLCESFRVVRLCACGLLFSICGSEQDIPFAKSVLKSSQDFATFSDELAFFV